MTILETENLTKKYGNLVAVDDVELSVSAGEIRSIIGPNGAGKSTLFDLITGMQPPTDGRIRFDGTDITGMASHKIAQRGMSRSFQITDVFGGLTALENIQVAAQVDDSRRSSMLRDADGLSEVHGKAMDVLADIGLDDRAHQRASDFAYGDRRKLEIGLAVANDPKLLLLDEPTAGMGSEDTNSTMQMVQRLAADRDFTVLLIEHDLEIVMNVSDRITVLQDGGVIAEGPPEAIQDDETVQEAYLGGVFS
ncbi:ABC transporter ATP-binding protein [Halostella sp. PRR32]|uniref:ABC transporter ATP-binding protein n=1 Tax=Halostella sp. PRR32 TaxID=3098147 RepID=UPI002B1D8B99|nr:ABC transporter ATP-binding protein [Halostella sp. PRR32]